MQVEHLNLKDHGKAVDDYAAAMAAIAPYLLALGQKRPKISTQKKAVSRPPKANMLICQITLGGLMAMA